MKTYYAIYDKILTTDSRRFASYSQALVFFTKKLWKYQIFTLIESQFIDGEKVTSSKKYIVRDGVAEEIINN